jgi:hypothetical protein
MKTKKQYLLEDLVSDKSFQDYVRKSDAVHEEKWKKWIQMNPHQSDLLKEAEKAVTGKQQQRGLTIL